MADRRGKPLLALMAVLGLALAACTGSGEATDAGDASTSGASGRESVVDGEGGGEALSRGEPLDGGSLRMALRAPIETFDVNVPMGSSATAVNRHVYDSLLSYDAEGNVVPELATAMETSDGGSTWMMSLPKGVVFHDRTPFDGAAVVAHLERVGAEGSLSREAGDVRQIAAISAVDEHTVRFELLAPSMTFPKIFTSGSPAYVPSPTAVTTLGEGYGRNPSGVGPFMVESFQPGGEIVLQANPDYRLDGFPYLDELVLVPVVDSQSRLAAVQAGDLDIGVTQLAADFATAEGAGLTVLRQPAWTYYDLLFNLAKPPFDDVDVRRAVMHAIDLEALNEAVFDGLHTPMTGMFVQDHPFYVKTDWPTYDPEAARELVDSYEGETGQSLSFTVVLIASPEEQRMAAVIQQMLTDVGITMEIRTSDQPTMISEGTAGNFEANIRFLGPPPETDRILRTFFHSDSGANTGQLGDSEFDELLDRAQLAQPAEREEIYTAMQHRLAEWLPIMPLVQHAGAYYVGDEVGGFPGALPSARDVEVLDVRQVWAQQ